LILNLGKLLSQTSGFVYGRQDHEIEINGAGVMKGNLLLANLIHHLKVEQRIKK